MKLADKILNALFADPMTVADLVTLTGSSAHHVTLALGKLERQELIWQDADREWRLAQLGRDRVAGVDVALTAKGARRLAKIEPIGNLHEHPLNGLAHIILNRMREQGAGQWVVWHSWAGEVYMAKAESHRAVAVQRSAPELIICRYQQGRRPAEKVTLQDVIGDLAFTLASLPRASVAA